MQVNDHILHITGGASIESVLENDTSYQLVAEISTFSVGDQRSRQDGTYDLHYKAKISGPVQLIKGDKIIQGKDPKRQSQKMRFRLEGNGCEYEKFMAWYLATKLDENIDEFLTRTI